MLPVCVKKPTHQFDAIDENIVLGTWRLTKATLRSIPALHSPPACDSHWFLFSEPEFSKGSASPEFAGRNASSVSQLRNWSIGSH